MIKTRYLAAAVFGLSLSTANAADKVDFARYAQSPAALSAIASAVSTAGSCSVPLVFEENVSDGSRVLGIHCRGNEDDEISIFIRFMEDEYSLLPVSFEYAG